MVGSHRRKYSGGEEAPSTMGWRNTEVFMVIEEEGKQEVTFFNQNDEFQPVSSGSSLADENDLAASERVLLEETMEEDAGLADFHKVSGFTPEKRRRKLSSEEQCDELVEKLQQLKRAWGVEMQEQSKAAKDAYGRSDVYKNGQVSGDIKVFHSIPEGQQHLAASPIKS